MTSKNHCIILVFSCFLLSLNLHAQNVTPAKPIFGGYIDAYYAYYTDSVGDGNYQQFPSVSPRSSFGLNTIMLTAQYDAEKVRGFAALHFGDIPRSAWSSTFNAIMEAHAGIRLCKKLWLDAGFFRTHFGTEGLLPKENFTSSVSVCTFYEPYFESGARLNYLPNDKLTINLYVLNGYNLYEDNNAKKSVGILVTYLLSDKGNIGYSNYIGDDTPTGDTISHVRVHQNIFVNYQIKKLKIQFGGDYCMQENSDIETSAKLVNMYSGVASLKYDLGKGFSPYARFEFLNDDEGFMTGIIANELGKLTGLKLWGITAGLEYKPTENSYIRLEGRRLQMDIDQKIFHWNNENTSTRWEGMVNMGVSF